MSVHNKKQNNINHHRKHSDDEDQTMIDDERTPNDVDSVQFQYKTQQRHQSRITSNSTPEKVQFQQLKQLVIRTNENTIHPNTLYRILFALFIALLAFWFCYVEQLIKHHQFQIAELKLKHSQMKAQISKYEKKLYKFDNNQASNQRKHQKLANQIIDIHYGQLSKTDPNIIIYKKHSTFFNFSINKNVNQFYKHFYIPENHPSQIRKRQIGSKFFYSNRPIPSDSVYYIQITIDQTQYGDIGIGVLPDNRKTQDCIYCDSTDIYYIYCKNGHIYHGELLALLNKSNKSRLSSIKGGDVITMFVDISKKMVSWYVNNVFAGNQFFEFDTNDVNIYPFVEMSTVGDRVQIKTI